MYIAGSPNLSCGAGTGSGSWVFRPIREQPEHALSSVLVLSWSIGIALHFGSSACIRLFRLVHECACCDNHREHRTSNTHAMDTFVETDGAPPVRVRARIHPVRLERLQLTRERGGHGGRGTRLSARGSYANKFKYKLVGPVGFAASLTGHHPITSRLSCPGGAGNNRGLERGVRPGGVAFCPQAASAGQEKL